MLEKLELIELILIAFQDIKLKLKSKLFSTACV